MKKHRRAFSFAMPLTIGQSNTGQPLFSQGELLIAGTGYEDKSDADEPYTYDLEEVLYNGANILPLIDWLYHTTLDGADQVHSAALAHVVRMFGQEPGGAIRKHLPDDELPDVFNTIADMTNPNKRRA
jgi:hypothetical protein